MIPNDLPAGMEALYEIALDLRWTWSHAGDELWRALDAEAWAATENPWLILQGVSRLRLEQLARDSEFRRKLRHIQDERRAQLDCAISDATNPAIPVRPTIAYFSMEFGFGAALPLYAGGLGVLAADHLKAANDLGLPIAGVGLLYQEGYFRQLVDAAGHQEELYPFNDPTALPIQPQMAVGGGWLRVPLDLPGRTVHLRVWRAAVGSAVLFLLDSNDPMNRPLDRGITGKLYDGGDERRLLQELVLGIAGYRTLEALGLNIGVCHLNEGHAAFALLERARAFMRRTNQPFQVALWATRGGNVFTTHTPVEAGFDAFAPGLLAKYFPDERGILAELGLSLPDLLALGRLDADDAAEPFHPTYLAVRGAARTNAVSALHGEVTRRLLRPLFPRWPEHEIPVTHITNGVHTPSWDSRWADRLWTRACGKERWRGRIESLEPAVRTVSDEDIWIARASSRLDLVKYARARFELQLAQRGVSPEVVSHSPAILDPDILTLGFARRFATYKRPNLLLGQPDRLRRLLTDPARPAQLLVAGKAHPDDEAGQALIGEWVRFASGAAVRPRVVYLEDYDITMAQELVRGVDVWINTPRRPFEACGTSGMKVLVNGGLNVSVLDGWWAEAYAPDVGWAISDTRDDTGPNSDAEDTEDLYRVLEQEIVPLFYERDATGIPRRWLSMVRASLSRLAPRFSASRMVAEYDERLYKPAEAALAHRLDAGAARAVELAAWEERVRLHLPQVRWGRVEMRLEAGDLDVEVEIYWDDLDPVDVAVELYADPLADRPAVRAPMRERRLLPGTAHGRVFGVRLTADRPLAAFTPRLVPRETDPGIQGELPLVLWHH